MSSQIAPVLETQATDLSQRKLEILASLNPYHQDSVGLLMNYYIEVKQTWSKCAIDSLRNQYRLKLNNKLNRCFFAKIAAQKELQNAQESSDSTKAEELSAAKIANLVFESIEIDEDKNSPARSFNKRYKDFRPEKQSTDSNKSIASEALNKTQEDLELELLATQRRLKELSALVKKQQQQLELAQTQVSVDAEAVKDEQLQDKLDKYSVKLDRFTFLLLTHKLLPPGPPLNGTENSPLMLTLGSPTTITELRSNYRKLIASEHPDFSPYPEEVAVTRFLFLRSIYQKVRDNWDKYKPTTKITQKQYHKRMNSTTPWPPESFWTNIA